jgi:hypothetical protein
MKKQIKNCLSWVAVFTLALSLFGCKGTDSDSGSKTLRIDISGLKQQLVASSSNSSSADNLENVDSPEVSPAQDSVKTLMIAPITYSNHGVPYSMDTFDKDTEDDFENDAANSINYLQFVQLPTAQDYVEVSVPAISQGWQLLAAATSNKVEEVGDIDDDGAGASLVYVGFTEEAFTSADDFTKANATLTMKRHCDQDDEDQPKGCATFDGDKEAIVTDAVEIHGVKVNGIMQSNQTFPWVVRPDAAGAEFSVAQAESGLNSIISAFGDPSLITSITVLSTHQLSAVNKTNTVCRNLTTGDTTSDFIIKCTDDDKPQEAKRVY